jgi:transposase
MGTFGHVPSDPRGSHQRSLRERTLRSERVLHRRDLHGGEKGGFGVGKTKRGKGTKLMAMADRSGLPFALFVTSASPHEVTLVQHTLKERFLRSRPEHLVGDRAYDSDPLDAELAKQGIELIAPHKNNRRKKNTQDGRPLRRYTRRWKIERLFAWLQNFRRLIVRYDYHLDNFLGFIHLACIIIILRKGF